MDWVSFYDFKHSVIYVNARHRDVHYRKIAEDIRAYVPGKNARVLDYGCGEAASAKVIWRPKTTAPVDEDTATTLFKMLETLEDSDDVQNVYANFEVSDALVAKMGG